MSVVRKRSIHLHGQKTSISLEDEFWNALRQIAAARSERLPDLINTIARDRPASLNLSSAVRLYVLRHFRASGAKEKPGPGRAQE
jgi:predicted DNA-binding ribbon-helix-helix protein